MVAVLHDVLHKTASQDPVIRVPYTDGMKDFLSEEVKSVIRYMREGNTAPPSDWVEKRQWSHDLMSMLTDTNKKPPRTTTVFSAPIFSDGPTTRKEIKPSMPLSGRVCPAFLVQEQSPSSEC